MAVVRVARRKRGWDKTARVAETAPESPIDIPVEAAA
jgi:hypothetical protein